VVTFCNLLLSVPKNNMNSIMFADCIFWRTRQTTYYLCVFSRTFVKNKNTRHIAHLTMVQHLYLCDVEETRQTCMSLVFTRCLLFAFNIVVVFPFLCRLMYTVTFLVGLLPRLIWCPFFCRFVPPSFTTIFSVAPLSLTHFLSTLLSASLPLSLVLLLSPSLFMFIPAQPLYRPLVIVGPLNECF
jgi:hypothetical protein